jgi:hypothetical protein
MNSSETILRFHISTYERPEPLGQQLYPIEARTRDQDGSEVIVLVYADAKGRLLELEILRVLPGPLIAPDWNRLEFYRGEDVPLVVTGRLRNKGEAGRE